MVGREEQSEAGEPLAARPQRTRRLPSHLSQDYDMGTRPERAKSGRRSTAGSCPPGFLGTSWLRARPFLPVPTSTASNWVCLTDLLAILSLFLSRRLFLFQIGHITSGKELYILPGLLICFSDHDLQKLLNESCPVQRKISFFKFSSGNQTFLDCVSV